MSYIVDRLLDEAEKAQRKGNLLLAEVCRDASDQLGLVMEERARLRKALLMWLDADDAGDGQECITAIAHARSVVGEGTP